MKIGLPELCIAAILALLLMLPFVLNQGGQENPKTVTLAEGKNHWDVFVSGTRTTWDLDYATYEDLPIKNSDYGSIVEYRGKKYTLWRVYSNQIQVSKEITDTK